MASMWKSVSMVPLTNWLKEKMYTCNSVDEEKALFKIKYAEVVQKWERKRSAL